MCGVAGLRACLQVGTAPMLAMLAMLAMLVMRVSSFWELVIRQASQKGECILRRVPQPTVAGSGLSQ